MQQNFNLKDVKYMRYLDYKLNNTPELMREYPGLHYPRLVEYIMHNRKLKRAQNIKEGIRDANHIFKVLWTEGLFHSCQA